MVASKTVGDWLYWLFLYFIACVPEALFGGGMASSFIYVYDHSHHLPHYYEVLHAGEVVAAVVCAAPGFVWVGVCQLRGHCHEQAKLYKRKTAEIDDTTVWPPPPK